MPLLVNFKGIPFPFMKTFLISIFPTPLWFHFLYRSKSRHSKAKGFPQMPEEVMNLKPQKKDASFDVSGEDETGFLNLLVHRKCVLQGNPFFVPIARNFPWDPKCQKRCHFQRVKNSIPERESSPLLQREIEDPNLGGVPTIKKEAHSFLAEEKLVEETVLCETKAWACLVHCPLSEMSWKNGEAFPLTMSFGIEPFLLKHSLICISCWHCSIMANNTKRESFLKSGILSQCVALMEGFLKIEPDFVPNVTILLPHTFRKVPSVWDCIIDSVTVPHTAF